jgi:phosphate transport system permease protein
MFSEKLFKRLLVLVSSTILLIGVGIVISLFIDSIPAFKEFGLGFIFSSEWDPTEGREQYGAFSFIFGTLFTSLLALLICIPLSFSVSVYINEYARSKKFANFIKTVVELLAGVPSIVYGLWGFYVIRPIVGEMFGTQGYGIMSSSIILALMIIPYASSISSEVISMVSTNLKEAAYSLGATKKEVIMKVIIPTASSGIFASYILALGRAIGETMAVTMLIGNVNHIPLKLTDKANTMASIIANQFGEASGLKLSSLIAIGLLLFVITGIVNYLGKLIIKRYSN